MEYKIITITPEEASRILEKNNVNRTLSPGRVNQYAYDIKNGLWQLNGEAIKFYEDGSLADGQHRLTAIIKANASMTTTAIYGLPKTVTIQDRGRNRNVTDSMQLEGMNRTLASNIVVGIAKLHYIVQTNKTNISDGMVKDFIKKNEALLLKLLSVTPKNTRKTKSVNVRCSPVLLACFYALNSKECSIDQIGSFLEVLHSGIPKTLTQTSAIVCRNDLLSGAISIGNSSQNRARATRQIEKAIYDFAIQYPRKVTYSNWNEPIYSNHINNKEV